MNKKAKFQYWASTRGWNWHLKAKNGRIVASGSGFNTKYGCLKSITRFVNTVHKAIIEAL